LQSNVTGTEVTLSWNKSNDAQTAQNGLSYNLYIGDASGTVNKRSPMAALANGYRKIVRAGVIQGSSWIIKNLPAGTYYWSVQAIDNSFAGGAWAAENTFTVTTMQPLSANSEISASGSLLVFPNPASTGFEIKLNSITNGKTISVSIILQV